MNLQIAEKQALEPNGLVDIHHAFPTIQGEGPFVGCPSVFIRLAGCNLQCPHCDTDYTSARGMHGPKHVLDLVESFTKKVKYNGIKLVVITGGEPLRQNIVPAVNMLLDNNYHVQIETNGTLFLPGLPVGNEYFSIVCSPKTPSLNPILTKYIEYYKYILDADHIDPTDGLPTFSLGLKSHDRVARPPENGYDPEGFIYVQPRDDKEILENARNLKAAIDSCMKFGYTLSLQTQKIIGLE